MMDRNRTSEPLVRLSLAEAAAKNVATGVLLLCREAMNVAVQDTKRIRRWHLQVLAAIHTCINHTAKAWPSRLAIASMTGLSPKTVSNALAELRGWGYLIADREAIEDAGGRRLTTYTLGNIDHEELRRQITAWVDGLRQKGADDSSQPAGKFPARWEVSSQPAGKLVPSPLGSSQPAGKSEFPADREDGGGDAESSQPAGNVEKPPYKDSRARARIDSPNKRGATERKEKEERKEDPIGDHASTQAEVDRLAGLDEVAYECERKAVADRLGIRATALDKLVAKRRVELRPTGEPKEPQGAKLPVGWKPSEGELQWVRDRYQATDQQIADQAGQFRHHWLEKGTLRKSWSGTWHSWWLNGYHKIPLRTEAPAPLFDRLLPSQPQPTRQKHWRAAATQRALSILNGGAKS